MVVPAVVIQDKTSFTENLNIEASTTKRQFNAGSHVSISVRQFSSLPSDQQERRRHHARARGHQPLYYQCHVGNLWTIRFIRQPVRCVIILKCPTGTLFFVMMDSINNEIDLVTDMILFLFTSSSIIPYIVVAVASVDATCDH